MPSTSKPGIKILQRQPMIQNDIDIQKTGDGQTIVLKNLKQDRYGSLQLIPWWNQESLRNATIMVVGAGALGNEVLKNLALMGVGRLFIVDIDLVEPGNLSRGILFRYEDSGRSKAETAASAIRSINPDVMVQAFHGNVVTDLGLGVFRCMDVIIGCLDNREARLAVNRFAYRLNKPWVDGAIQEMFGIARVFLPGQGACYECTLTAEDWESINLRYSCSLLNQNKLLEGRVPTTPTIASIIAAIQTQESMKLLHGMPVQPGKGIIFNGLNNFSYQVEYPVRDDCLGHDPGYESVIPLQEARAADTTLANLLALARERLGPDACLELDFELVTEFYCPSCEKSQAILQPLRHLDYEDAQCPQCHQSRQPLTTHAIYGTETYLDRTLLSIGIPPLHILSARNGTRTMCFELSGDEVTFYHWI